MVTNARRESDCPRAPLLWRVPLPGSKMSSHRTGSSPTSSRVARSSLLWDRPDGVTVLNSPAAVGAPAITSTMNVAFPLRDGYFKPLQAAPEDARRWKQRATELLQRTLLEEAPYWTSHYTYVDTKRWKSYKERDRLQVYQARRSHIGRHAGHGVLGIGTIDGSLEDVVYGMHSTTTTDMRVTTSYLSTDALDAAVLHVFENGTHDDPYRSLSLKWRVVETPGGSLVAKRDGCVLEYTGIDVDPHGHKYAFRISESVDHPVCPPFSSKCAIRAKAYVRILYRQVSRGRVGVYFQAEYDLGGKIPGSIARRTAAEMALSLGRSVACAEAKKLTALALATSPIFHRDLGDHLASLPPQCSICSSRPKYLSTKSMTWCKICGETVCSKCRSRRSLLSDEKKIRVSCCKQCLVAAKHIDVDPSQPLALISHGRWLALMLSQARTVATAIDRSTGGGSEVLSSYSGASSARTTALRLDTFDNLLTPISRVDDESGTYDDDLAVLESPTMASVMEDEEEIPTLEEFPSRYNHRFRGSVDDPTPRYVRSEYTPSYSRFSSYSETPQFARSAYTPSVAKSEAQAAIHREADRMSLYSQMRRLRDQAEDVYSLTRANGWEYLGPKASTSSRSSMRSTAVMSTASYSSTACSQPSIG